MLDALRKGTGTWIAKIFIGLLVLSFAVWGISDIFGGYGRTTVAKVGETEITSEDYRFAYQLEMRMVGRQLGRTLSADEAQQIGLDNRVLSRLIAEAALNNHGDSLSLGVSDRAIAEEIFREPAFQDSSGNFNRRLFEQVLHANNMSEAAYVAHERDASVRRQLTVTVGGANAVPDTLLEAANVYRNERRVLRHFTVPLSLIDPIGAPDETALRAFYEDNEERFTAPEYRQLGLIVVTPELVAPNVEVGEEEIATYYEQNRARFETPERRHVLQMNFSDPDAAAAAYESLRAGTDFLAVAEDHGFTQSDIDLGAMTRERFADPAVADAAFALGEGRVGEPVEGRFGTVLLKVTQIEDEDVRSLDDARDEIRDILAQELARHEVMDLHDHVEDHRAAAAQLSEIAEELNLTYIETSIDRSGNTPDGEPPADVPSVQRVAQAAFDTDVGIENDPIDTENNGVVWFDVMNVTPAQLRPFDEVRQQVESEWRAAEEQRRLADKARELAERVRGGETLDDVAAEFGLDVLQSQPVKRDETDQGLPRSAIAQAFGLPRDGVGTTAAEDGQGRVTFQVAAVEPPPPLEGDEAEGMRQELRNQLADDMISQYVTGLRDSLGVSVNRTVLDRVLGRESG